MVRGRERAQEVDLTARGYGGRSHKLGVEHIEVYRSSN